MTELRGENKTMDKKTYLDKLEKIENNYELKVKELKRSYAISNNPVKIGDIIKDHIEIMKVEKIKHFYTPTGSDFPACVYHGIKYTKKIKPYKNKEKIIIFQDNLEGIYSKTKKSFIL